MSIENNNKKQRIIIAAVAGACVIVIAVILSIVFLGKEEVVEVQATTPETTVATTTEATTTAETEPPIPVMLEKYEEWYAINDSLVGWVWVDGTNIDNPVMQNANNSYYLEHDFYRQPDSAGTIFVDFRTKLTDTETPDNIVMYGHNMATELFFADVAKYRDIEYFKEHQIVNFDTLYEENEWVVFAAFLTGGDPAMDNGNFFEYHSAHVFDTQEVFDEYYNEVMNRTYFNTDVEVTMDDKLITMSTCLFSEYYNARFVIVARKAHEGEDLSQYANTVTINEDKYMTAEWHYVNG